MTLVDLDAEQVRIRNFRSRAYFSDALKSYRAGAFRAAISATWVALAYDILSKYRELSALGDGEASSFLKSWDAAVQGDNTAKLLECERSLLDHANNKLALFDAFSKRTLKRLYEDRHLCAHPAFANEDDLYEPSDELVRTHMIAAIEIVLAQPPIQGKGIFNAYSNDVQSSGFPNSEQKIADYVEQKYLARMRPSAIRNFGIVLAKSLVRNVPQEWEQIRPKISASLHSIKTRRPEEWGAIQTELVRLMNDDDPGNRIRTLATLGQFPELIQRLDEPALVALQESVNNDAAIDAFPSVFAALQVDALKDFLLARFETLDYGAAGAVLRETAPLSLWPNALSRYADSGSYRGAESNFDEFIAPFRPKLESSHLTELFEAIEGNDQIWNAARTPNQLLGLLRSTESIRPSDSAASSLYNLIDRIFGEHGSGLDEVWTLLEARGWTRPEPEEVV